MGKQTPLTTSFNLPDGREVTLETGKLAALADGAVVLRIGTTMLLATAVSARDAKPDAPFFPLFVEYQEKFAAIGRIPGNFFKREGRLSEHEILVCRLIDRVVRPLFPNGYMNETQIAVSLISGDKEELPDAYAALAASAALAVSEIPFAGPISEVRVARINGEFVINPKRADLENADMDFIVGATADNVVMVEGEANECSEEDLVEAMKIAHEAIKVQINAQLALAQLVGEKATVKRAAPEIAEDSELEKKIADLAGSKLYDIVGRFLPKMERKAAFDSVKEELETTLSEEYGEEAWEEKAGLFAEYYYQIQKETIRRFTLDNQRRLDGRRPDEVRNIWAEIDYLPGAHGSALFTRGETQSLTSLTLGTKLDEQMIDTALDFHFSKFILHYNFPSFSTGEAKMSRGPGRREIGHANLAGRALKKVLPAIEDQPYTIRIVSDILESNGSSSMATVCAGSLALMDAGIKVREAMSGIAMGLITDGEKYAVLSDILGDEDHLGDMDFKVVGTRNGICSCQMDIKVDGLPVEVLTKALHQAKEGRLHILSVMNEVIDRPNADLKPHAPRIIQLFIDKSFIGAVIGPGGKIVQEIQQETGTTITIEEVDNTGIVSISSSDKSSIDKAVARIKSITVVPSVGDEYEATVKALMPFGVIAEFLPGKTGLVHISELSHTHVKEVSDVLAEGDTLQVKLIGIDPKSGKFKLSRKALLEAPAGGGDNYRGDRDSRPPRKDDRSDRGPRRRD
jgi:polyribonucleotide nucleotidyltransferase